MNTNRNVVDPFAHSGRRLARSLCASCADEGSRMVQNAPHPRPLPEQERGATAGFTLIESLIIISIIGIMSGLALQALPVARSNQQLISDTEQIRALLSDAKQRAVNQVRPTECIKTLPSEDKGRAPCSDVGIAFEGNKLIEFADTNSNNRYDDASLDYLIVEYTLTNAPGTGSVKSLLFKSNPPVVILYADGAIMTPSSKLPQLILNGYGDLSRTLLIHPYGTIDVR